MLEDAPWRAKQEVDRLCIDIQNAIHLAKNLVFHYRTKHTTDIYHFIRELVDEDTLS